MSFLGHFHPGLAQWVEPTVDSATNLAGISITLAVYNVMAVANAALHGATLFAWGLLSYGVLHIPAVKKRLDKDNDGKPDIGPGNEEFQYICYSLTFLGLLFQWTHSALPFPLNILFFPLTALETSLKIATGAAATEAAAEAAAAPDAALNSTGYFTTLWGAAT